MTSKTTLAKANPRRARSIVRGDHFRSIQARRFCTKNNNGTVPKPKANNNPPPVVGEVPSSLSLGVSERNGSTNDFLYVSGQWKSQRKRDAVAVELEAPPLPKRVRLSLDALHEHNAILAAGPADPRYRAWQNLLAKEEAERQRARELQELLEERIRRRTPSRTGTDRARHKKNGWRVTPRSCAPAMMARHGFVY